jgi:Ca2+:H+ antiporter
VSVQQLWTHAYLYRKPVNEAGLNSPDIIAHDGPQPPSDRVFRLPESWHSRSSSSGSDTSSEHSKDDEDENEPKMLLLASVALLVGVTVLCGITAEIRRLRSRYALSLTPLHFLVSSINGLTAQGSISKEFVALILLPCVASACRLPYTAHVSAQAHW